MDNPPEPGGSYSSSDFSVLTAKGEGQAEMTREALRGYPFDLGFRSPESRQPNRGSDMGRSLG